MTATQLSDRALIRVAGEEARDFLQGLVTRDVRLVQPDAPQWAALLTAQGKVLFDFILWDDDEGILIDCEAAQREALVKRLTLYRLRRPVTIEAADGAVHWSTATDRGVPDPRLAALGHRWLGSDGPATSGWLDHRLRLGVIEGVAELGSGQTLWLECNARELNGVSFDKGCFIGQENTARMHYRGKVNRRLVVVPLDEETDRTRIAYPELGLMIEHRRVETLDRAQLPDWLKGAIEN